MQVGDREIDVDTSAELNTDLGLLSPGLATTNNGVAEAELRAGTTAGTATLTVTSGGIVSRLNAKGRVVLAHRDEHPNDHAATEDVLACLDGLA